MYVKADQRGTDFILEWDVRSKGDSSQGPWPSIPRLARAERGRPLSAWSGFARRLELRAGEAGPSGPQSLPGTPARLGHPGTVALCPLPARLPPCAPSVRPLAALASAAYAWASDRGRGGPAPQSPPVQPAGEAGRRPSSGFSDNVTDAASAQAGSWGGPGLGGEVEPRSSLTPPPAPSPTSSGAKNRLSHGATEHARRGENGEGGPETCGMWPESRPRGLWGGLVFSLPHPRPEVASGLRLSGADAPTVPRLQLDAGQPRPLQRKKPGGGWSGVLIRPGTTFLLPAPCASPSGAE